LAGLAPDVLDEPEELDDEESDDEVFVSVFPESDFDSPLDESPPDESLFSLFFFELSWASFSRARFFVP
jgi:hypothetical protein